MPASAALQLGPGLFIGLVSNSLPAYFVGRCQLQISTYLSYAAGGCELGMRNIDSFEQLLHKIDQEQLYRTREVAALLQCSVRYVQLLVELGRLEALRVGRMIRIPGQELVMFIHKYKDWESRN